MKRTVLLGAPSSTGKGAKQLIAEAFASAVFPLLVTFENKVGRAFSLPEVGIFLDPCTHPGHVKTVTIKDFDALQRTASTIEQLGFLNNIQGLIAVEADVSEVGDADPNAGGDNPDATGGEANGQADGEQSGPDQQTGAANHGGAKSKTNKR
jgi:hypothetical protein